MAVAETPETEEATTKKPLILDSLEIKNFRAFRHLTIEKLGRVNLITGKNSVGKTALLEAVWLYTHGGYPIWLRVFLEVRDETSPLSSERRREDAPRFKFLTEDDATVSSIRNLFFGRRNIHDKVDPISVGPLQTQSLPNTESVKVSLEWLIEDKESPNGDGWSEIAPGDKTHVNDADLFLVVRIGDEFSAPYRLLQVMYGENQFRLIPRALPSHFVTVPAGTQSNVGPLWDNISLTNLEDNVVSALQIIDSAIERVSLIGLQPANERRVPFVKIRGGAEKFPLRSFGAGINRLFEIVLALVNATNGVLLVDEIENGLHYSVMPKVWRLILETARLLNVQVFVTTHSWECIEAFQQAATEDEESDGVLIRLQREDDNVTSTIFDERRLEIMTRRGLEVR